LLDDDDASAYGFFVCLFVFCFINLFDRDSALINITVHAPDLAKRLLNII